MGFVKKSNPHTVRCVSRILLASTNGQVSVEALVCFLNATIDNPDSTRMIRPSNSGVTQAWHGVGPVLIRSTEFGDNAPLFLHTGRGQFRRSNSEMAMTVSVHIIMY